jgi:hypothetical protein
MTLRTRREKVSTEVPELIHGRARKLIVFAALHARVWPLAVSLAFICPRPLAAQEWYELYADGVKALRNGQARRAADLLERAIAKRPQPGASVPTYGTNFEPAYYPYLRLAEAQLVLGSHDDVRRALETSARLGLEPAAERAVLEARLHKALEASRPPPPTPSSTVAPAPTLAPALPAAPTPAPTATPTPEAVASPLAPVPRVREPVRPGAAGPPAPREASPALDLTSEPPGARVFVDDEPVGRTDPQTGRLRLTALSPGRHRIRLSAEGRLDLIRELELGSEGAKLEAVLPKLPTDLPPAAEEGSALARPLPPGAVWALGLGVTVLALGLWARSLVRRPSQSREAASTPSRGRSGGGEAGTDEIFPMSFDDFVLVRRIGKGGMAAVYEATRDGERFALKRPLAGFLDDPHFLERFQREAELGRTLHHPNIVRIFERGQVGNTPYFVMELVLGETLRACLDREGALDPPRAVRLVEQVAEALDYAHSKGVIHRDLKPSNIMLETQDRVKVMDYGIARAQRLEGLTTTGAFLGTPYYAAPETVEGGAEPRSDLYSLGVVFFEMLTGSLPFRGDTSFVVMRNHCTTPPPVPSSLRYTLSAELDRIVLRLLSKAPKDRPTAEELLNELRDSMAEDR